MKPREINRNRPLRILHVEYGVGFGGSIVSLSELVRGLTTLGAAESTVVTFQPADLVEGLFPPTTSVRHIRSRLNYRTRDALGRFMRGDVLREALRTPVMKAYAAFDILHERWLGRELTRIGRSADVDLVHSNNSVMPSALLAARALGVPCVVHFRGMQEAFPRSVRARYGKPADSILRYIAISEAVAESARAYGAAADRMVTIHNPVSLDPYVLADTRRDAIRALWSVAADDLVIGVFGRVTGWKGQLEFLDDVRPLFEQFPNLRVFIVGDESDTDDPTYGNRVREMAASPLLRGKVMLTGYQKDVPGYYAACDIVVHCSRDPEPFGRVVIEGMAASKPVVAMNEAGPVEIIADGVDGLLVRPRDGAAMRRALITLCQDAALRTSLGARARETVRTRFTPEVSAHRFVDALNLAN